MPLDSDIRQMTVEEKLRTMEALWDDLCRNEEQIELPQWHKDVLDEREQTISNGKAQFINWEIAKKQINSATASAAPSSSD